MKTGYEKNVKRGDKNQNRFLCRVKMKASPRDRSMSLPYIARGLKIGRSRSPTDPLPPLLDPSVTEDDVPGYMKLKNYKIFKPEKETYLTMK